MKKIFISFGVMTCLAASGCSGQLPQSVQQPTPQPVSMAPADLKPIPVVESRRHSGLALSRVETRTLKTTTLTKIKSRSKAKTPTRIATENGPFAPRDVQLDTIPRVSGVAKVARDPDTCPSSKHGHAEFLRTDLAYSDLGVDCQGDKPAE